ncbi:MAG: AAA family ATPase [Proteobacteria bacterium]|nr:AAA family ATPase [Pseudomonadota bacterium]
MLSIKNLKDKRVHISNEVPVCLNLKQGNALALTGQNGSGKTTLLRIIVGILESESVDELFVNHDFAYLPSQNALYLDLKVKDYTTDPLPFLKDPSNSMFINELSSGQKRKLALSLFFKQNKSLWIMDEPTTHLDKNAVDDFYQTIDNHCQRGGGVLISTHDYSLPPFFKTYDLSSESI